MIKSLALVFTLCFVSSSTFDLPYKGLYFEPEDEEIAFDDDEDESQFDGEDDASVEEEEDPFEEEGNEEDVDDEKDDDASDERDEEEPSEEGEEQTSDEDEEAAPEQGEEEDFEEGEDVSEEGEDNASDEGEDDASADKETASADGDDTSSTDQESSTPEVSKSKLRAEKKLDAEKEETDIEEVIMHVSNLCLEYDPEKKTVVLGTACQDEFDHLKNKAFEHTRTGKCLWPISTRDNSDFTLENKCDDDGAKFVFTSKGSIKQLSSGKCIHPLKGSGLPELRTKAVLHKGCDDNRMKFSLVEKKQIANVYIKHHGGLCLEYDKEKERIVLRLKCKDPFMVKATGEFINVKKGECLKPDGHKDNSDIILGECDSNEVIMNYTDATSIIQRESGKCLRPYKGGISPEEGTRLVLHEGCDQKKNEFELIPANAQPPVVIRHTKSNLCISFDTEREKLTLSKKCDDKFRFRDSGAVTHIVTSRCLSPSENEEEDAPVRLDDCRKKSSKFYLTDDYSLQHGETRKCIHPMTGEAKPTDGTSLVLLKGCDEKYLEFEVEEQN